MPPYTPITREQYFAHIQSFYAGGLAIMQAKNADYASESDPFRNFRMSEAINIKPEVGILIRMQDKMSRIGNLLSKETNAVKDESIHDTLVDLANYAAILNTYLQTNKRD